MVEERKGGLTLQSGKTRNIVYGKYSNRDCEYNLKLHSRTRINDI